MTETVKIEVQADVTNAQQGMASLRDDLKKTKKESEAVGTSFGEISRGLGSISPQLGRVSQSIGKLTDQMKKLGVQTGSNGAFGRMTSGLGRITSSSGFRKGIGILGLGVAAGGILSSLMGGGGNNKLAGFDQLNAMGQETMIDFLTRQFKNLKTDSLKPIAEATTVTAENTTKLLDLYKQANPNLAENGATDPQNIPEQIIDIEESGQTERTDITKKGWTFLNNNVSNFLSNFNTTLGWLMQNGGQSSTTKLSDSISYTGTSSITKQLVDDLKDKVDNGTTESKSLLDKIGDALGGAVSAVSDFANTALDTMTSVFDLSSNSATKSTVSTSSSNPLVKWAANLANKSVNGGLLNEGIVGSIIAMGGGASAGASATAKGASLLSKVGRALGIPFLAEGGLFMPNQPQLAILGDNKSEMEVAAPRSMIVDAVREAVSTSGSATTMSDRASQPIPITLEIDGKTLARILYDPMNNETIRRGGML